MKKYVVTFSGFAYVEAESEEEAEEKYNNGDEFYKECSVDDVEETDAFIFSL